jgi:hypothetical protein
MSMLILLRRFGTSLSVFTRYEALTDSENESEFSLKGNITLFALRPLGCC